MFTKSVTFWKVDGEIYRKLQNFSEIWDIKSNAGQNT